MRVFKETPNYAYYADSIQGVGRFVRKTDHAVTLIITGQEHIDVMEELTDAPDEYAVLYLDELAKTYDYME